jgi:CheY-like chemotaxis protein
VASDRPPKPTPSLPEVTGALHDVSNALTVLLGWVAEARAPGATADQVEYALRIVEQRARAARDLARRAIGGATEVIERDEAVDATISDCIGALAVEAQSGGVTFTRSGSVGLARARGTADLSHVLTNLLFNALAYAPRGSTVTVSLATSDANVLIDVIDEGPGVPLERRESIFEGDSTRTGGAGVGLRHGRAAARRAGGDLELLPSARGAHFRLRWPRADVLPRPPSSVPRIRMLEGTRVLIIEDDEAVTLLLESALEARGAEVTVAHGAQDLPAALAKGPHDAALVDLSPIARDPKGALAALRKSSPDASLVVITGSVDGVPEELLEPGVTLVRKPFEVAEIVAAISGAGPTGGLDRALAAVNSKLPGKP